MKGQLWAAGAAGFAVHGILVCLALGAIAAALLFAIAVVVCVAWIEHVGGW